MTRKRAKRLPTEPRSARAAAGVTVMAAAPVVSAPAGAGLGALLGAAGVATATLSDSNFYKLVLEYFEKDFIAVIVDTGSEAGALEVQALVERSSASASLDQSGAVGGESMTPCLRVA